MNGPKSLEQVTGTWRVTAARGLSQEALALETGVERNYMSLIELGCNSPSLRIVFKLSSVLGISASTLVADAENRHGVSRK
jgi:transcriptional regulator with XRE-family HTH domain